MRTLLYLFPVALLVAYSQIIVKWRASSGLFNGEHTSQFVKLVSYLSDPYILSGYATALIGSFLWLFIVPKLPLSIAFPVYIGLTFSMVIIGSVLFIKEPLTLYKLISVTFILLGIIIGSRT